MLLCDLMHAMAKADSENGVLQALPVDKQWETPFPDGNGPFKLQQSVIISVLVQVF